MSIGQLDAHEGARTGISMRVAMNVRTYGDFQDKAANFGEKLRIFHFQDFGSCFDNVAPLRRGKLHDHHRGCSEFSSCKVIKRSICSDKTHGHDRCDAGRICRAVKKISA